MDEFEVTCKVTKGERDIAYGEDCFCYYTQPNYNERIVRCKDCKHGGFNDDMHNGFCDSFSGHILWVEPDGFCSRGERRDDV